MLRSKFALVVIAGIAVAVTTLPATAAGRPVIVSSTKVVGNNVVIKSSGGTTTVDASNSCSAGITGYLFQSVLVLFGGGVYAVTQSTTCP